MNRLEKILLYLDGKMTDEELSEFKEQLKIDPELMAELDIHRLTDEVSRPDNEERFREKLANAYIEFQNEREVLPTGISFPRNSKYGLWIISSAAAIIIALLFILNPFKPSQEDIFAKYYQPYSSDISSRSSFNDTDDYPEKAIKLYLEGDYNAAYEEFMTFSSGTINNSLIYNYYFGLASIEEEKYNIAIEAFEIVLREDFSFLHEHAQWYLSLIYVKLGKYNLARENLMDLKLQGSVYSNKSKKILKKIPRQ